MDGPGYKISQAVQHTASLAFQENSQKCPGWGDVAVNAFLFQKQLGQGQYGIASLKGGGELVGRQRNRTDVFLFCLWKCELHTKY